MNKNRGVLQQLFRVLLGVVLCDLLMLAVFALMHRLTGSVILGAAVGTVLSVGNFFILCLSVGRAADSAAATGNAKGAQRAIQGGTSLRLLALLGIYILLFRNTGIHPIASLLPLVFTQLSLYATEFFRGGGDK